MNNHHEVLSILVPAWKHDYFYEALTSIAKQTDLRFSVIIFDDAGPGEIRKIAEQFPQFAYIRFENNLGGSDLVGHWNRCLKHVRTEWVWIFSDDDVMSSNCVSEFYQGLNAAPDAVIFQFTVKQVDSNLYPLKESRPLWCESAEDFILARMSSEKISCVPDHIFNWKVLNEKVGGFVSFPLAWNADDATWALLAKESGTFGLANGEVLWRQSQNNISTSRAHSSQKFEADLQYLEWLRNIEFQISFLKQLRWLAARFVYVYEFNIKECPNLFYKIPNRLKPALIIVCIHLILRYAKRLVNKAIILV